MTTLRTFNGDYVDFHKMSAIMKKLYFHEHHIAMPENAAMTTYENTTQNCT